MAYAAAAVALIGGLSSAYGSSRKTSQVNPDSFNIYGEKNTPAWGAIKSRDSIFDALNSGNFQRQSDMASGNYVQALQNAASDPRLGAISGYGSSLLRGDYLNSPIVNRYADNAADRITAAGADDEARLRSNFASNGMGFSSGLLQALQAARTRTASQAATTKAGILANNYQSERGYQQQAPSILSSAVNQPLSYLGAINPALYQPLQLKAGLTTGLLGGGNQIVQPTLMQQPSTADQISAGLQSGLSLYSLYKNAGVPKK